LPFCLRCRSNPYVAIFYLSAEMPARSQLRLLQSILALERSGSAVRALCQERCAFCSKSSPSTIRLANSPSVLARQFTTSNTLSKKGKTNKDVPVPDNASEKGRRSEVDPYDYSVLESGISKAIERLKEALTKTRSAGRISPETIENLSVEINIKRDPGASGRDHKESGRLGDFATVVPKGGRVMQVFVAEESVRLAFYPALEPLR
jgi:hypothetical protein